MGAKQTRTFRVYSLRLPPANCSQLESLFHRNGPRSPSRSPRPPSADSPSLLPPVDITPEKKDASEADSEAAADRLRDGLNIERPRSALHSGDFTHNDSSQRHDDTQEAHQTNSERRPFHSQSDAWISTSPPRNFTPFRFDTRSLKPTGPHEHKSGTSSLSSSLSSSFIYKPPTSPLAQSQSNDDVDLSLPMNSIDIAAGNSRNPRRHTLTSHNSAPYIHSPLQRQTPALRRDSTYPYQAHQPRRSLNSTPAFSLNSSSPQTPALLRTRRPSFSSDTSPLQHASMVGSYEESILRGRMSTTPSKPLDFQAQIGVLGLGKCKASLRCPPHVTLSFPAVFYSYATTSHGRSKIEDGPSPYVGQIDLENGLANPEEEMRAKRKAQSRTLARRARDESMDMDDVHIDLSDSEVRRAARQKRRSNLPKAPPGGAYRIPEKGQLQIIIKNQNKTAVKLFLIPYDLAGMEPGTKTFIRQRSYSAGSIIDNMPDLKETNATDRPILRYLVHLHICSPSRGRYYLYKSIRVVFANRVPDGKEKLRNELTFPEPRFTTYKPIRVMHPPMSHANGPGAMLTAEKAFRRRSSGYSFGPYTPAFDPLEGLSPPLPSRPSLQGASLSYSGLNNPVEAIPFRITGTRLESMSNDSESTTAQLRSPGSSSQASRPTTQDSCNGSGGVDSKLARYDKLSKGDVGYGGNAFLPLVNGSPGAAEGLLSQRLRSLGVQGQSLRDADKSDTGTNSS